jgi:hypothetical protein
LGNPPSGSQPTSVIETRNITTNALTIDALLSAITTATASASDRSKAAYGRSPFGFDSQYYHCAFPATRGQADLSRTKKTGPLQGRSFCRIKRYFFPFSAAPTRDMTSGGGPPTGGPAPIAAAADDPPLPVAGVAGFGGGVPEEAAGISSDLHPTRTADTTREQITALYITTCPATRDTLRDPGSAGTKH